MFTGLIEAKGRVASARKSGSEMDLDVDLGLGPKAAAIGDSVAVSGVCCTVTGLAGSRARFRLSAETLRRTWLGDVRSGHEVNVERALRAGQPMGGHVVQGHVDGVAEVVTPVDARAGGECWLRLPRELGRYCVEKGSIALDGISLTIAALDGDRIMIAVIPHTAAVTTIGGWRRGERVHVEVDVLAKYVEKLIAARLPGG